MDENETKVLEAAALLYNAIPGYLAETQSKQQLGHLLVDLIDALERLCSILSAGTFPAGERKPFWHLNGNTG